LQIQYRNLIISHLETKKRQIKPKENQFLGFYRPNFRQIFVSTQKENGLLTVSRLVSKTSGEDMNRVIIIQSKRSKI
jgi:hypothetical protein